MLWSSISEGLMVAIAGLLVVAFLGVKVAILLMLDFKVCIGGVNSPRTVLSRVVGSFILDLMSPSPWLLDTVGVQYVLFL